MESADCCFPVPDTVSPKFRQPADLHAPPLAYPKMDMPETVCEIGIKVFFHLARIETARLDRSFYCALYHSATVFTGGIRTPEPQIHFLNPTLSW